MVQLVIVIQSLVLCFYTMVDHEPSYNVHPTTVKEVEQITHFQGTRFRHKAFNTGNQALPKACTHLEQTMKRFASDGSMHKHRARQPHKPNTTHTLHVLHYLDKPFH